MDTEMVAREFENLVHEGMMMMIYFEKRDEQVNLRL